MLNSDAMAASSASQIHLISKSLMRFSFSVAGQYHYSTNVLCCQYAAQNLFFFFELARKSV